MNKPSTNKKMREWTKREWEKTHSKAWYPAKPYDHDDCVKVSWRYAKEAGVNDLHKAALEALWVMEKFKDQAPLDWYYDKEYEALRTALQQPEQQRPLLTDEEIQNLGRKYWDLQSNFISLEAFARAIERKVRGEE